MRGSDEQTKHMFSYLSPRQSVRADHPVRAIRTATRYILRGESRNLVYGAIVSVVGAVLLAGMFIA